MGMSYTWVCITVKTELCKGLYELLVQIDSGKKIHVSPKEFKIWALAASLKYQEETVFKTEEYSKGKIHERSHAYLILMFIESPFKIPAFWSGVANLSLAPTEVAGEGQMLSKCFKIYPELLRIVAPHLS